jgi:hypothetical protein
VEILTDDEIGLTCSNPPESIFDLSGVPVPLQTPVKVSSRGEGYHRHQQNGFRSLSGDNRTRRDTRALFCNIDESEDSPLLVSSIVRVATKNGGKKTGK